MKTRGKAIHAFCKECIYDPKSEGTWRQQVEACPATNCPLYEFRPISERKGQQAGCTVRLSTQIETFSVRVGV